MCRALFMNRAAYLALQQQGHIPVVMPFPPPGPPYRLLPAGYSLATWMNVIVTGGGHVAMQATGPAPGAGPVGQHDQLAVQALLQGLSLAATAAAAAAAWPPGGGAQAPPRVALMGCVSSTRVAYADSTAIAAAQQASLHPVLGGQGPWAAWCAPIGTRDCDSATTRGQYEAGLAAAGMRLQPVEGEAAMLVRREQPPPATSAHTVKNYLCSTAPVEWLVADQAHYWTSSNPAIVVPEALCQRH